jgi:excisionase family DNA binding protein
MMIEKSLCSVDETEQIVPVKKSTLRSWILQGKLPVVRLGRRIFIKYEIIQLLLDEGLEAVELKNKKGQK